MKRRSLRVLRRTYPSPLHNLSVLLFPPLVLLWTATFLPKALRAILWALLGEALVESLLRILVHPRVEPDRRLEGPLVHTLTLMVPFGAPKVPVLGCNVPSLTLKGPIPKGPTPCPNVPSMDHMGLKVTLLGHKVPLLNLKFHSLAPLAPLSSPKGPMLCCKVPVWTLKDPIPKGPTSCPNVPSMGHKAPPSRTVQYLRLCVTMSLPRGVASFEDWAHRL